MTIQNHTNKDMDRSNKSNLSLLLGFVGLAAWLIPLAGFPVTIYGIVCGLAGSKTDDRGTAMTGLVLCFGGLLLTIIQTVVIVYILMKYYELICTLSSSKK